PSKMAKRLAGYGVKPADLRIGHDVRKGYKLEQFTDVFARYLHTDPENSRYTATKPEEPHSAAPSRVALPVAPEIDKRYSATPENVAENEDVAPPKATRYTGATPKPALEMRCSGVAPTGGVAGDEDVHAEVHADMEDF
ncbi:MAG: DUF3631 domain-containing protein, partial [Halothiobacillaceae bacterium]|nr:DUF3631 domain-containing protein [Halothiobacillaceae bacterium]